MAFDERMRSNEFEMLRWGLANGCTWKGIGSPEPPVFRRYVEVLERVRGTGWASVMLTECLRWAASQGCLDALHNGSKV